MREGGLQHAKVIQGERNITEYPPSRNYTTAFVLGITNEIRVSSFSCGGFGSTGFFVLVTQKIREEAGQHENCAICNNPHGTRKDNQIQGGRLP